MPKIKSYCLTKREKGRWRKELGRSLSGHQSSEKGEDTSLNTDDCLTFVKSEETSLDTDVYEPPLESEDPLLTDAYQIPVTSGGTSLLTDGTNPESSSMKRIIDERITAIPHDIFVDDGSDTDSATSNVDEDKRDIPPVYQPALSHEEDHMYFFSQTSGLSDVIVGINPSAKTSKVVLALPSASNKEATVTTPQNTNQVESRKNPTPEEINGLLDLVALEVNRSLVGPLFAKRSGQGISVLWISNTRPSSVIGEIFVLSSGEVEVYAKGYQLSPNHVLWTKIAAPVPLMNNEVQRFVQHVNQAVNVTREYIICGGVTEQKQLWDTLTKCLVERNEYREPETCRSESCDLLVAPQRVRCADCKSLCLKLRNRKKKKTAD